MTTVVLNTTTRKVEAFSSARDVQARAYGHDSRSALGAAIVPMGIEHVFLRGYAQAGDGGAAHYKRVASEPAHAGKIQSNDGTWWEIAETIYNAKQFGATGDGSTDDTTALNNVMAAADTNSVGAVHIPAGTYIISDGVVCWSNVRVTGDGMDATIIRIADSSDSVHAFGFTGRSGFSIQHLTVQGGDSATIALGGHGIRLADCDDWYIGNVRILDAWHYGIGLSFVNRGVIENVWIERSGGDGIDVKNHDGLNESLTINNITIIDPGVNTDTSNQAGLDLRGPVNVSNVFVKFTAAGDTSTECDGVRFRGNAEGTISRLTNFHVEAEAGTSTRFGVLIGNKQIKVSNGYVSGMTWGVVVEGGGVAAFSTVQGATATACVTGFWDASEDSQWIGCRAVDCSGEGFRIVDTTRPQFIGCHATGNDRGFRIASSTEVSLIGCISEGNTTDDWSGLTLVSHVIAPMNFPFGLPLTNGHGVKQAELGNGASSHNYLRIAAAATGAAPVLSAQGSDTNVDLTLTPKGTGKVRFGTHSAIGAEALSGYIEIKDAGGILRKVAVVS